MGNSIKVNCYELYKNGIYLSTQISRLKEIIEEMKIINNEMKDSWKGIEYDNFYQSFDDHLNKYDNIETNVIDNVNIMKDVAKKHGNIDEDLVQIAKRWEVGQNGS